MDFEDFKRIFRYWSVNKYVDGHQFSHVSMKSRIRSLAQFQDRYKTPEFYLTQIKVTKSGLHTFGVSQYGERLLPRRAQYKYANCSAFLVKAGKKGTLDGCTFVGHKVTRQDRDTFIECEIPQGIYYMYVDLEWQPESFKWLKKNLGFAVNCYAPESVEFTENIADSFDQCETLDHILMSMSVYSMKK